MIGKFQSDLKGSILKTTQEFLFQMKWLIVFLSEYSQTKTAKFASNNLTPEQDNEISIHITEV